MATKKPINHEVARRAPRQARSQLKVELMLEAAIQLLEAGSLESLTTNAVAAKAGVSIGTLYQYFGDKHSLLEALIARELGNMADRVLGSMERAPSVRGERIRQVMRAVVQTYGGRSRAHRQLMRYELSNTKDGTLSPMRASIMDMFTTTGVAAPGEKPKRLTKAQAFVLTHAMSGVLSALGSVSDAPPLQEVEDALVLMVLAYLKNCSEQ
jgi:AcrR family transcriptional regulator